MHHRIHVMTDREGLLTIYGYSINFLNNNLIYKLFEHLWPQKPSGPILGIFCSEYQVNWGIYLLTFWHQKGSNLRNGSYIRSVTLHIGLKPSVRFEKVLSAPVH